MQSSHYFSGETLESAEDLEESIDINEAFETSVAIGSHAFAKMEADVDRKRRLKLKTTISLTNNEEEQFRREHQKR